MIVDVVQVVQNHEQSLAWITVAEVAEGFADVQGPLATTKQATEAVGVQIIIESQKLFGPLQTAVGRAHALGLLLPGPSDTADRFPDPVDPIRRNTLPRCALDSADRAPGCVFSTVERGIRRGLPGAD